MRELDTQLSFAAAEIADVESFRRLKNTAVLTIMFTDIEGFTELTDQRGEKHSNEVRRLHDEVLEEAITRGNAGLVVKHIGDAIMAVFSEPSTAVERALEIQAGLDRLNLDRPDLDPLKVRIGLDMGQVTVEDNVDVDVFGRHVNRASRVEGLAAGGQVYMSYTVFDSARGWLSGSAKGYQWTSHGRFKLKGITGPVEVFEVVDPARSSLTPPQKGDRIRSLPGAAWAAAFVLVGVVATFGYLQFQHTEVFLSNYEIPTSYLDGTTEVLLDGEAEESSRRLLADVGPGMHVLHYDVAGAVRYYAELDVVRGENRLRPEWVESRMPTIYRSTGLEDDPVVGATRGESYFVYNTDNQRIDFESELTISIELSTDPADPGTLVSALSWRVDLDGSTLTDERREFRTPIENRDSIREEFEVYSDDYQRYSVNVWFVRHFAHLEVNSEFRRPGGG